MKLISWNVNGLRAVLKKGFEKFFNEVDADIFCIQETKIQEEQIDNDINNILKQYNCYWNSALKKRIFWNSSIYKKTTNKCFLWFRNRRT